MPVNLVSIFEVGEYEAHVDRAAKLIADGGIVVLPTETVYGAAGLVNHKPAQKRLRDLRGGGEGPFTIHLADRGAAENYLGEINDLARRMMRKLWPGPVALMFDVPDARRRQVAQSIGVAESDLYRDGTITLRYPDHIVASDVIRRIDGPVALTRVEHGVSDGRATFEQIEGKVDFVLEAGPSRFSKPSTIVRVRRNNWEIVRTGIYDQRIIERLLRTTVLFVCSGNTCRSPMAEALARRIIAEELGISEDMLESKGITVLSAGAYALPGSRATPQAVDAVKALGGDLSKHRSRPLTVELINQADHIFAMGKSHLQSVIALVPAAADKTTTLDPDAEIEDPIGGDASLYNELATSLKTLIEKRLKETVLR